MIAIPFIYFTLLALYLMRKNGGVDISVFLLLVYAFSAGCSILLDAMNLYDDNGVYERIPLSIEATISYCALLTLSILPFRKVNSMTLRRVDVQSEWWVDALAWVLIFTFFTTLLSTFANLDIALHTDLKDVRDEVYANEESVRLTGFRWLLALPGTLFSQFSPVAIVLYFINIAQQRKTTLFNWLLLLSSFTPILSAILIAGRTQPIYWFLSFSLLYLVFRPMLDKAQRRQALLPFIVLGSVIAVFIGAVTIARFATGRPGGDSGALDSVIAYSGQSFLNFNYFFCKYTAAEIHLDRIFPLTNYFIVHPGSTLTDYRDMIWSASGLFIGVFYTFLGDLLVDLGHVGMWVYVLLFSLISYLVCRTANREGTMTLSRLLVVLVLVLIPLQGIFYYSYYKVNVGYFVVGTLLFSGWLHYRSKHNEVKA